MFISLNGTNFVRGVFSKINLIQYSPPDRANFLGVSRNVMLLMEPRHPLPCSQQPITGYYPEPVNHPTHLTSTSLGLILIYSSQEIACLEIFFDKI